MAGTAPGLHAGQQWAGQQHKPNYAPACHRAEAALLQTKAGLRVRDFDGSPHLRSVVSPLPQGTTQGKDVPRNSCHTLHRLPMCLVQIKTRQTTGAATSHWTASGAPCVLQEGRCLWTGWAVSMLLSMLTAVMLHNDNHGVDVSTAWRSPSG